MVQPGAKLFKELLSHYADSYQITSLCANYLHGIEEYQGATKLLQRLVKSELQHFTDHDTPSRKISGETLSSAP